MDKEEIKVLEDQLDELEREEENLSFKLKEERTKENLDKLENIISKKTKILEKCRIIIIFYQILARIRFINVCYAIFIFNWII